MKKSFSSGVKSELMSAQQENCCRRAECYGMLICSSSFSQRTISLYTESREVAERYIRDIRFACGVAADITAPQSAGGLYICTVTDAKDRLCVLEGFSHKKELSTRINFANFENECCYAAFLRGAFLVCGSITNPEKNYRLEFSVQHKNLAADITRVLYEVDIEAHIITRGNGQAIYINESEHIEDLLTMMGAQNSALDIMNIKIVKDLRNKANRITNCETANISKTADAAARQMFAARVLIEDGRFDDLPASVKEAALLRLNNPEMSLGELSRICGISKSGLNHRLKKLEELARQN